MSMPATPAPAAAPTAPAALQRYVDDEILRAPMVIDMALQELAEPQRLGAPRGSAERQAAADLMLRLQSHRPRIIDRYVGSLREQTRQELQGSPAPAPVMPGLSDKPLRATLSLVDDDEVAVDVAISHAIEAIKSEAEVELRELLLYTSALAGDMEVRTDHNPLRPETQARALWAGAQALPMTRGHQIAFMRQMAMPMATALRKAYAGAAARLEAEGVEPAAYRTVIPPAGPRTPRAAVAGELEAHLSEMRKAAGGEQPIAERRGRRKAGDGADAIPASARLEAASNPDQPASDLMLRLYEMLLSDRRTPAELQPLLARLQPFAVRTALRDAALIHEHERPFWRFIDAVVHEGTVYPGEDGSARASLVRFANAVIDQLAQETDHTDPLYAWALERLRHFSAKRLADRCAAAEEQIATMQALEDRLSSADAAVSTLHGALDAAQLDTVPAALLEASGQDPLRDAVPEKWLLQRRAGEWLRLFHQGHWIVSQLLWPGDRGEVFMFGNGNSDEPWAVRRSALLLLHREGLAEALEPRSVVHDAAVRLLRRAAERQPGA